MTKQGQLVMVEVPEALWTSIVSFLEVFPEDWDMDGKLPVRITE